LLKQWQHNVQKFLEQNPVLQLSLPGFQGASIYQVMAFFIGALQKGAINTRAAAVSFKFFLALFPAIIFLFTLIPFILKHIPFLPNQDYVQYIMIQLQQVLPSNAYAISSETILDILSQKRQGLLSFTFLLTLYFSTNGLHSLIESFNQSINMTEKRSVLQQRVIAVLLLFISMILIILTIALTLFSDLFFEQLIAYGILKKGLTYYLIVAADWALILSLLYFLISFVYYFAPANRTNWTFFSAGSSLSTLLILSASYGFTWYVTNFGNYNKLYGSIGTLLVVLIWVNLISTILIIGFELNSSIQNAQNTKN